MSRWKYVVRWLAAILLLLASVWCLNIAFSNWFAADFHNQYSRAYASRGNIFSIVALVLLAVSAWVIVATLRSAQKRRKAKA